MPDPPATSWLAPFLPDLADHHRMATLIILGDTLGVDEAHTREVVDVWTEWYKTVPLAFSWDRVTDAVWARWRGNQWRP